MSEPTSEQLAERERQVLDAQPTVVRDTAAVRIERASMDTCAELLALDVPHDLAEPPEAGTIGIVVGETGAGKSTWLKVQAALWLAANPQFRMRVFDYCDEWSRFGRLSPHVRLGPCAERCTLAELRARPELLDMPGGLAIVPEGSRADRAQDFRDLCELLDVGGGAERDCALIVEECWSTASLCDEEYGTLATLGRHVGLSQWYVAQWASGIPHHVRRQAAVACVHHQSWRIDLDACVPPLPEDAREQIPELAKGERILWLRKDLRAKRRAKHAGNVPAEAA